MSCTLLLDRVGKEVPGVLGKNDKPKLALKAVDITENCNDLDPGLRVVLTYVNNRHGNLLVVASIESKNGQEARIWQMRAVKNAHDADGLKGKAKYSMLKGFKDFAKSVGLAQVVLANYILAKKPT